MRPSRGEPTGIVLHDTLIDIGLDGVRFRRAALRAWRWSWRDRRLDECRFQWEPIRI